MKRSKKVLVSSKSLYKCFLKALSVYDSFKTFFGCINFYQPLKRFTSGCIFLNPYLLLTIINVLGDYNVFSYSHKTLIIVRSRQEIKKMESIANLRRG